MKTTTVLLGWVISYSVSIPVSYSQNSQNENTGSMGDNYSNDSGNLKNYSSLPDLQCSYFWWESQKIMEGTAFWVCVRVSNAGTDPVGSSHVKVYLSADNDWDLSDDYYLGMESVDTLSSGDYDSIQWNFNFPDLRSGCYPVWIIAVADCNHEIIESNENNTWKCYSSFKVIDPPDLYVNNVVVDIYEIGDVSNSLTPEYSNNKKSLIQASFNAEYAFGLIIPEHVEEYYYSHPSQLKSCIDELPDSVDWSIFDSPVKNQASNACQSCWAFAAVALIENLSNHADLSEQVVVSCAGSGSCLGGWTGEALKYIGETGVPAEDCYPYMGENGDCSDKCADQTYLVKVSEYDYYPKWNEPTINTINDLKVLLQNGPVIVSMNIPQDFTFFGYTGGIYNYDGGFIPANRKHAVLVVGYNDPGQYFRVKNSWDSVWGEKGYFRIAYDDVTDDINFGGYACTASGVYTKSAGDEFVISNLGGSNLEISNIYSDKSWLSFNPSYQEVKNILPGDSVTMDCVIDWNNVAGPADTAVVTIDSNDPYKSGFELKVFVIPYSDDQMPENKIINGPDKTQFKEKDVVNDIVFYPNPASDFISIRFTSEVVNRFKVTLIDNLGKIVYVEEFEDTYSGTDNKIDISGMADGIYFLKIDYQNGIKTGKLIKE